MYSRVTGQWAGLFAFAWVFAGAMVSSGLKAEPPGVWVAGDFHNHSFLTDGTNPAIKVLEKSTTQFGLSWIANSEHGGTSARDPQGRRWEDSAIQPPATIKGDVRLDGSKRRQMWRWQSLCEYSFPIVAEARKDPKFAGKLFLQGLEFNCPGHYHVSTGILADSGLPMAEFEYRFDSTDADISGGPNGQWKNKNTTNDHAKALTAIAWLDEHYRGRSWFVANHPELTGTVRIEDLRDFNNAAPEVAFGFEGAPGHQKYSTRGGYGDKSFKYADNGMGGATYGGVGVFVARVGGVWDALLGEGRRFYTYANSDFHQEKNDFWPGEYHKTYVKIAGPITERAVLDGLRAGKSFFASGDLVDAIEFEAGAGGRVASMGQALAVSPGSDVQITMRLHDPLGKNALGEEVSLRSMDLIGGDVTGSVARHAKDGKPNPAYGMDVNPSARVLAHFDSGRWRTEADGWIVATFTIKAIDRSMYVRLRGTNFAPGTAGETDEHGNPLSDALANPPRRDGAEEARADLWFYANPVFIRVK
jgi:hypothetical protein